MRKASTIFAEYQVDLFFFLLATSLKFTPLFFTSALVAFFVDSILLAGNTSWLGHFLLGLLGLLGWAFLGIKISQAQASSLEKMVSNQLLCRAIPSEVGATRITKAKLESNLLDANSSARELLHLLECGVALLLGSFFLLAASPLLTAVVILLLGTGAFVLCFVSVSVRPMGVKLLIAWVNITALMLATALVLNGAFTPAQLIVFQTILLLSLSFASPILNHLTKPPEHPQPAQKIPTIELGLKPMVALHLHDNRLPREVSGSNHTIVCEPGLLARQTVRELRGLGIASRKTPTPLDVCIENELERHFVAAEDLFDPSRERGSRLELLLSLGRSIDAQPEWIIADQWIDRLRENEQEALLETVRSVDIGLVIHSDRLDWLKVADTVVRPGGEGVWEPFEDEHLNLMAEKGWPVEIM